MARDNSTWGEERIAHELNVELGIRISPRTVRKYLHRGRPSGGRSDQRWATFIRNPAQGIVACDFFVSVTCTFQVLYVFVAMEIASRRILHCNVTARPRIFKAMIRIKRVFEAAVWPEVRKRYGVLTEGALLPRRLIGVLGETLRP